MTLHKILTTTVLSLLFLGNLNGEIKVLAFAGSAREFSMNKILAAEAADLARQEGANVTLIDLKDYPILLYDGDLETNEGMPPKAKQLRQQMIQSDIIIIASPEHNGSLTALLKNIIDWASRNENRSFSKEAFQGKKFVIISASPGQSGGARSLEHLRKILENLGGTVMSQQVSVPDAYHAFDEHGHLKNPKLKEDLKKLIHSALEDHKSKP